MTVKGFHKAHTTGFISHPFFYVVFGDKKRFPLIVDETNGASFMNNNGNNMEWYKIS